MNSFDEEDTGKAGAGGGKTAWGRGRSEKLGTVAGREGLIIAGAKAELCGGGGVNVGEVVDALRMCCFHE